MSCEGCKSAPYLHTPRCKSDELTFAEAMALDPSEVEFQLADRSWRPLLDFGQMNLYAARKANYRRARPKRSRVQEMAHSWEAPTLTFDQVTAFGVSAIRAVCEYLRRPIVHERDTDDPTEGNLWASAIERHFLEPR